MQYNVQSEYDQKLVSEMSYKYQQLTRRRDGWRTIFGLLCKYIRMRPVWFGDTNTPWRTPNLSVANVSDDAIVTAARSSSSSIGGALWPNNDESFEIIPKPEYDTEENRMFCNSIMTQRTRPAIGSYEGRFYCSHDEHCDEQVVMGTSGLFVEEDFFNPEVPFRFRSCSVETCVIDEDPYGCVDTVHFEHNYSARQVVDRYGYEKCSPRVQGLYDAGRYDDYIRVIHAVEPRDGGQYGAEKKNKPYKSIHWEYDSKWLLLEDGMDDRPVFMARFRKLATELYGRSLGMDALPSVKELNVLRQAFTQAMLLILRPPMGYYNDQIAGGGNFDMSPGARVALYMTGRIPQGQLPIMPLLQIQLPPAAEMRIQNLTELVDSKFLNDILTDFNNKTRMTLGEAQKREELRFQSLSSIFTRQLVEVYYPMLKYVINSMFRRGMYGLHPVNDRVKIAMLQQMGMQPLVIPEAFAQAIAQGKTPYIIRFISPAARAMTADAMRGLEQLTNYGLALTNAGATHIADNFDADMAFREAQSYYGAPASVIVSMEAVKKMRKVREQAQQAMQQYQQRQAEAEIAKTSGKATLDYAKAGQTSPLQLQQNNTQWLGQAS